MKNRVRYRTDSTIQRKVDMWWPFWSGADVPNGRPTCSKCSPAQEIGQGCRHPTPMDAGTPLEGQPLTGVEEPPLEVGRAEYPAPGESTSSGRADVVLSQVIQVERPQLLGHLTPTGVGHVVDVSA